MSLPKILIINPHGIGDVLFTTPAIRNLRRHFPQSTVSYLSNRRTAAFLEAQADIDRIFIYERDEAAGNAAAYLKLWSALRQEGFQMSFDFSLNDFFGFLAMAAGIKKRVGFDWRGRGRFLTDRLKLAGFEGKHVIEYDLDLLRLIGIPVETSAMKFDIPSSDLRWAQQWLADRRIGSKPLVAVVPGGGASWGKSAVYKRWPAAQYAQLIDKIIENFDAAVILLGDSSEDSLGREVARLCSFEVHSAVGQTTILQMAAVLTHCRAAVVNDGGPLHVAVACATKTVSIFGPVDPQVYGPYPAGSHLVVQKNLPCRPCYRRFRQARCGHVRCLAGLSVEEVYRKVQQIL